MSRSANGTGRRPGDPPEVILFIRSFLFWVFFFLSTIFFAITALFLYPFSFRVRYIYLIQYARLNLAWLWITCRLKGEVEGLEHIPARPGVILAKHQSTWETLALQRIFPMQAWVLKRELLRIPFFGWGLALLRPIAIDRKAGRKAVEQVVEQGRQCLEEGRWVVIFPEGTRTAPGEHGRYRVGGALLAERAGVPVVPMAHNAGEYWPRHGFIKRPGIIRVRIGPVIDPDGKSAQEILQQAEGWIETTMAEITSRPELYATKKPGSETNFP